MSELESLNTLSQQLPLCTILCSTVAALSNFKFRGITKNAGNFRRDLLGAKFSINDPKK